MVKCLSGINSSTTRSEQGQHIHPVIKREILRHVIRPFHLTGHSLLGDLSVVHFLLQTPVTDQPVEVARLCLTVPIHPSTEKARLSRPNGKETIGKALFTCTQAHTHTHTHTCRQLASRDKDSTRRRSRSHDLRPLDLFPKTLLWRKQKQQQQNHSQRKSRNHKWNVFLNYVKPLPFNAISESWPHPYIRKCILTCVQQRGEVLLNN